MTLKLNSLQQVNLIKKNLIVILNFLWPMNVIQGIVFSHHYSNHNSDRNSNHNRKPFFFCLKSILFEKLKMQELFFVVFESKKIPNKLNFIKLGAFLRSSSKGFFR